MGFGAYLDMSILYIDGCQSGLLHKVSRGLRGLLLGQSVLPLALSSSQKTRRW